MKIKICPVCAIVSAAWLLITAGIVFGLLEAQSWKLVVAIAMGGTVAGIADKVGKQKPLIIGVGMILSFLAVQNLSGGVLFLELAVMLILAYWLFIRPEKTAENTRSKLEEKLKNCC